MPLPVTGDPETVKNDGKLSPTLETLAFDVLQVAHAIAPAAEIVIGDVPLSPALPTLPIGRYWKVG